MLIGNSSWLLEVRTIRSSFRWLGNSFFTMSAYATNTFTMVFANLFMYLFQISGSGHSSLETTSKHWVNCVKTSTTETLNSACSLLFWNCNEFT